MSSRVASAKARLRFRAAAVDAGPNVAAGAAGLLRHRPWQGVGLALIVGVALGAGRGRVLRTLLAPAVAPLLVQAAASTLRGGDAIRVWRASRGSTRPAGRDPQRPHG